MDTKQEVQEMSVQQLAEELSGESRRMRQIAATELSARAKEQPDVLLAHASAVLDALNRPEAQTRWECLEMLALLVDLDAGICEDAIVGAETALFDENSGFVRLGAMRFLCRIGAVSPERSEMVWDLIDEGIQCYHGDPEFTDMLLAVTDFSTGNISQSVKERLAARMKFDAENARGSLGRRAKQIIDNVSKG